MALEFEDEKRIMRNYKRVNDGVDKMIFSETDENGVPTWWKVFKGAKTVTRRAPPCKNCGKKAWEHYGTPYNQNPEKRWCKKFENGMSYEPDLTRWQPNCKCGRNELEHGDGHPDTPPHTFTPDYKSIAIQPARTKAAICKNCGGWKEWHNQFGDGKKVVYLWGGVYLPSVAQRAQGHYWLNDKGAIKICSSYVPLRLKIKSVMMESEWSDCEFYSKENRKLQMIEASDKIKCEEARREGFETWEGLQAALKRVNPKNAPLARIEME